MDATSLLVVGLQSMIISHQKYIQCKVAIVVELNLHWIVYLLITSLLSRRGSRLPGRPTTPPAHGDAGQALAEAVGRQEEEERRGQSRAEEEGRQVAAQLLATKPHADRLRVVETATATKTLYLYLYLHLRLDLDDWILQKPGDRTHTHIYYATVRLFHTSSQPTSPVLREHVSDSLLCLADLSFL